MPATAMTIPMTTDLFASQAKLQHFTSPDQLCVILSAASPGPRKVGLSGLSVIHPHSESIITLLPFAS